MFIPNRIHGTHDISSVLVPIQDHFSTPAPSSNTTVLLDSTMTQRSGGQNYSVNQSGNSSSPTISLPNYNKTTDHSGNNINPGKCSEELARNVPLTATLSQSEFDQNKTVIKNSSFIPTPVVPIPVPATTKENQPTKNSTSNAKPSPSLSNSQSLHRSPSTPHAPFVLSSSLIFSIVIPPRKLSHFPTIPRSYVLESGIVFYAYANYACRDGIKYMPQTLINARFIKEMDPTVSIILLHYYNTISSLSF